jgi:hypothetical protein
MRIVTLLFAAVVCGAPALAQTASDQAPAPAPAQATPPAPAAPAPAQAQPPQAQAQPKTPRAPASEAKRQDRAPPNPSGRYSFRHIGAAVMRLDRETGSVSVCRPHNVTWSCDNASENGSALERQIAQLRDEIADLKKQIANLRAPPPPPRPPADVRPRTEGDGGVRIELPTRQDIARARGFIADTWHRLVEMIEHLQKDMMRKS